MQLPQPNQASACAGEKLNREHREGKVMCKLKYQLRVNSITQIKMEVTRSALSSWENVTAAYTVWEEQCASSWERQEAGEVRWRKNERKRRGRGKKHPQEKWD